jgi:hypothetical protein
MFAALSGPHESTAFARWSSSDLKFTWQAWLSVSAWLEHGNEQQTHCASRTSQVPTVFVIRTRSVCLIVEVAQTLSRELACRARNLQMLKDPPRTC